MRLMDWKYTWQAVQFPTNIEHYISEEMKQEGDMVQAVCVK